MAQDDRSYDELLVELSSDKTRERIVRWVSSYLRSQEYGDDYVEAAEDLAQAAICSAWRALPNFRRDCDLYLWLSRIATNKAKDMLKKRCRDGLLLTEVACDDKGLELDIEETLADEQPSAEQIILSEEFVEGFLRLLKSNPQKYLSFALHAIGSLTYEEVTSVLGLKKGTVKSQISRARQEILRLQEVSGGVLGP